MAKTLLEITQEILSEISGDDVSSIFDTEEAEQVARHVIAVHDNIAASEDWPSMRTLIQLTPSGDSNFPNYMSLPSNVKNLESLHYDTRGSGETRKKFTRMIWKDTDDFLRLVHARDNTASTVDTITDASGVELFIRNDLAPSYFTSFDDTNLIFDAYNSAVDSTLQASKTQAVVYVVLTLSLEDSATHSLPADTERRLIEESISRVQFKLREVVDVKSEQEAQSQKRTVSRNAWRANKPTRYPDYGRGRRNVGASSYYKDVTFVRND